MQPTGAFINVYILTITALQEKANLKKHNFCSFTLTCLLLKEQEKWQQADLDNTNL